MWGRKKREKPGPHNRRFHDAIASIQNFLVRLPVHVSTYWFDLRENALSLLISGFDRLKRDREREREESVV